MIIQLWFQGMLEIFPVIYWIIEFFILFFFFSFYSDDPSFWGALPLTHDFYFAFLGIASAKQDLRAIKKLILNSFEFSSLDDQQKSEAKSMWLKKWDAFIEEYLKDQKSAILVENRI